MSDVVLALNAGSSSLKLAVYRREGEREVQLLAESVKAGDGQDAARLDEALLRVRDALGAAPDIVGHRLVHGGDDLTEPTLVDDAVMKQLEGLAALAPLHLPPALGLLRLARERLPRSRHVAVFDTTFHRHLPDVSRRLPLPKKLRERGLRRYGFHGLSCEYALTQLGQTPPARVIVAHLGSGASLTAVRDGRSFDTTMGLTPTGGIPMSSRAGDLDPGVIVHLLRHACLSVDEVERLLNHESGLKGLSGSADMAELLRRSDEEAILAVDLFCYAVKKQIGAYAAALGGVDCLVFTGGIGEHSPEVRARALSGLATFGLELDTARNAEHGPIISSAQSRCTARVIRSNEALMIARHCWRATESAHGRRAGGGRTE